jgi:hypothetical protein
LSHQEDDAKIREAKDTPALCTANDGIRVILIGFFSHRVHRELREMSEKPTAFQPAPSDFGFPEILLS